MEYVERSHFVSLYTIFWRTFRHSVLLIHMFRNGPSLLGEYFVHKIKRRKKKELIEYRKRKIGASAFSRKINVSKPSGRFYLNIFFLQCVWRKSQSEYFGRHCGRCKGSTLDRGEAVPSSQIPAAFVWSAPRTALYTALSLSLLARRTAITISGRALQLALRRQPDCARLRGQRRAATTWHLTLRQQWKTTRAKLKEENGKGC